MTKIRTIFFISCLLIFVFSTFAKNDDKKKFYSSNWFQIANDSVCGCNSIEALKWLKSTKIKPKSKIVVGIIDTGVDTTHVDLKSALKYNIKETQNGLDNDKNGYKGDVFGWNFLGSADGTFNMQSAGTEEYREFKRLYPKYKNHKIDSISKAKGDAEFLYYVKMRTAAKIGSYLTFTKTLVAKSDAYSYIDQKLKELFPNKEHIVIGDLSKIDTQDQNLLAAFNMITMDVMKATKDTEWTALFKDQEEKCALALKRIEGIEKDVDKRTLLGDNMLDANDRFYGNPDVMCKDYEHGSSISGIIACQGKNKLGVVGIYPSAKLMCIRAVPNGDEYDKDIASAIRYAVDNGAKVVNMSFGKTCSTNSKIVEDAIQYASEHDVLLVQAAGNNGVDIDVVPSFPKGLDKTGQRISNLIRVGASDIDGSPAGFSNYGKVNVDLFAPGVEISSIAPNNGYSRSQGTSVASPIVASVAAMIRHYFPQLTAAQVRDILLASVTPMNNKAITLPNKSKKVITSQFKDICLSGGLLNALQAVKLAYKTSKK